LTVDSGVRRTGGGRRHGPSELRPLRAASLQRDAAAIDQILPTCGFFGDECGKFRRGVGDDFHALFRDAARRRTSGVCMAAMAVAAIFSLIAAGRPRGATNPCQE